MVDIAIPQVNFYSMLSGLGDTIQANRVAQAKKDAFAAATTPGPDGKIDYGKAILGLAQVDPQAAAIIAQRQNHEDTLHQQAIENARAAANDAFNHTYQNSMLSISKARLANELDPTPDNFVKDPSAPGGYRAIGPADPNYIASVAAAKAAAVPAKPVPIETLGGTKFLVRSPNSPNGYSVVDPQALPQSGQPQQPVAAPNGPPAAPPTPTAPPASATPLAAASPAGQPTTFADRFSGAFPQTASADPNAPVTPVAAAPNQPQSAAPPAQPVDINAVDPNTGRREGYLKSLPPDAQAYIKKIADYEIDPRTTSLRGGMRERVLSAVAQYDPTYDQNNFASRAKAIRDFATGQQGNAIRSFDVAVDHLDTLQKYADALKSGNVRLINQLRNTWQAETGSSLPTNVQAVAPIVGAEVSKAIIGSNNTLADREELRKPLNTANSPEQLAGAIQGYKALMAGQLKGLQKQYEDTTGKKDFNNRIRQNTRNVLLRGESSGADQQNVTSTGVKWSIQ
jgi:hypothetical protein